MSPNRPHGASLVAPTVIDADGEPQRARAELAAPMAVDLVAEADWICASEVFPTPAGQRPAYEFRQHFTLLSAPTSARLAATAHGVYEAFVNGVRVGDEELTPGLTSYGKTLYVQQYDVRGLLEVGDNELRVVVSDGWYRGRCGPSRLPDGFGTHTAVLAQLDIQASDGLQVIATGPTWQCGVGTITAADLMDGQTVDFTRSDAIEWAPVAPVTDPNAANRDRLAFSPSPPVRRIREIGPVTIGRLPGGRQIIDFGENLNGWVRLSQLGPAGTRLTLTHGEALDHDGNLTMGHLAYTEYPNPEPLPVGQTDSVVSRGNQGDTFEPRHTTHGFRYVAIDGLDEDLEPRSITAILVHTDLDQTGTFTSSDDRLNRLHRIARASWRANACDVPTDCPQRERWGYTGDYQIFVQSAAFLDDVEGFSRKWLRSLADDQREDGCITNVAPNVGVAENPAMPISFDGSAGWGDAATVVPWQIYQAYGDESILDESFSMMRRWVDYAARIAATERHPARAAERPTPAAHEQYLWDAGFHWGEWAEPGGVFDYFADKGIIATAYLSRSADIVSRSASILHQPDLAERYAALATQARDAWQAEYLTPDGRLTVETQANYVRGLAFGLIPESGRATATARLVQLIRERDTHLSTGFLSTPYLLPVLADNGRADVAFELLFQDTEPSWMTMLERGATTIWESWGGIDADGNPHESLNHYSKGAVINFLHEYIVGVRLADADSAGYRQFTVAPHPAPGLTSAEVQLQTRRGLVASSWRIIDREFVLEVVVPEAANAVVVMPSGVQHQAGSGQHTFREPS